MWIHIYPHVATSANMWIDVSTSTWCLKHVRPRNRHPQLVGYVLNMIERLIDMATECR
jgi:hypothetical protein